MAKSLDKEPIPATGAEPPPAGPSLLVAEALREYAALLQLVQGEGEHEIDFAVRAISELRNMLALRDEQLSEQHGQIAALKRQLAAQRGVATKAKARIIELEEAGKPRALGPMAPVFGDDAEAFTAEDLMTAIDAAEQVVLAFSDGKAELRGIRPRQVRAEAFRLTRGRVHFIDEPLELTGPGAADEVTTLVGVALLLDGEQAAWAPMAQPIAIGAGQTINLAGSVIFG